MSIFTTITDKKNNSVKQFAVLVDPDKPDNSQIEAISKLSSDAGVDYFFVGGSLLSKNSLDNCIKILKANSSIPVIIFPGNNLQISSYADAILFLSLISGRNPDLLIGNHVIAAPYIKESGLEVIPTAYMLIDSGKPTSALYMSNTMPIPADKSDIAACTAMAGEMLGLKMIYLDAGSGAINPISAKMIESVRANTISPIICGGGINSPEKAVEDCKSGADIVVVGNGIEKSSQLIKEVAAAVKSYK